MLRITSEAYHDQLTARKEDIILNGSPGDLRGNIVISNKQADTIKVRSLPLKHGDELGKTNGPEQALHVSARLNPGEEKHVEIHHRIHPATAPGVYKSTMMVGGEERNVTMVVQQHIEINVQPTHFTCIGTKPGTTHHLVFTLTNLGNIPFEVPEIKHVAALDMDMLCSAFGAAMRNNKADGYEQVLDDLSRNIKHNLPDWAEAKVAEFGTRLQPGESRLIHVTITIPQNCRPQKDYYGNMRFWDTDISYAIKSSNAK